MIIKIDYVTSTSIFSKTRYRTNPAFARPVPKYDIENPTSNLTLGQTFQTWDEAEKFLNDYALEKGFSIRRKRTENDDNKILRKISWECCCAGNYQPKKILNPNDQRNRQSKATGCKWRVNGNLPKNSLRISFTTVVDEHNH
ncbi:hypothetical protein RhiirA5_507384 [Rhizophagus irregularis]|uniref:FAR1 domain-containing protein n=1 Tax=Rhizophagus irregularis TaxID=588596 RepID=A0A2N0NKQ3_9GLOM|nr:hypothetical protein RhiirA5_507384 [Rhizophagus irregularis]CAB4491665.1 unnamed protein product [Rhizophagus irregularis]CAB5381073.1 unnamed protein product [Rhizophagus irregularis]